MALSQKGDYKMTRIENILTGNGNLKSDAHKQLKGQFHNFLVNEVELDATPNGDFAKQIAVAVTEDGTEVPVYVRVEFVVTTTDPFVEKPAAPKKTKTVEKIVIPQVI